MKKIITGTLAANAVNLTQTYTYHPNSAVPRTITSNDSTKDVFRSTYRVTRQGRVQDVISESLKQPGNTLGLRTAVGYHYNEVGQRTRATREDGNYWSYQYNDRGEVTSAKKYQSGAGSGQVMGGLQYEYDYDDIGNRTEMRYGGDEAGDNLRTVSYDSNGHNQYTMITHPGYHQVTGLSPVGGTLKVNTQTVASSGRQGTFFFKELQESNASGPVVVPLSLEETPTGGSPSTTNLGDIFVPDDQVSPQYQNGNLVNDGRWIYSWSPNNRLLRMEPTTQATAAHTAAHPGEKLPILDFLYDWRGRRISKMVTYGTTSSDPSTTTTYAYDGWNIVATIKRTLNDLGDLEIVRPVWGLDLSGGFQGAGGVGGLLTTRTADVTNYSGLSETERHFPSYDGNGNIIAWTDDAGGTTTTRDFDAFGNIVTNQGDRWSESTAFGFSTKLEDQETGLFYYGFRQYDPGTGRWPSRDPIGERGGMNLYGMVKNNAVKHHDYLGQKIVTVEDEGFRTAVLDALVSITHGDLRWAEEAKDSHNRSQGTRERGKTRYCLVHDGKRGNHLMRKLKIGIEASYQVWIEERTAEEGTSDDRTRFAGAKARGQNRDVSISPEIRSGVPIFTGVYDKWGMGEYSKDRVPDFAPTLWHELVGHVIMEFDHPDEDWNVYQYYRVMTLLRIARGQQPRDDGRIVPQADPTNEEENEARFVLGLSMRRPQYYDTYEGNGPQFSINHPPRWDQNIERIEDFLENNK